MTFVGIRDGVGLLFEAGTLSSISMSRFGRSFDLHEELASAPAETGQPLPYLPLEAGLDMSEANFRNLDPYTGMQVHQALASGQRTVSVLQGQSIASASLLEPLLARVHMDASLAEPLAWRLRTAEGAVWESDESGAEAFLGKGCSVRLSSTAALAIEEGGRVLHIDLPAGASAVEMWIEAQPPVPLAPAVIVCTPAQMREAAIAASAIGSTDHAYVPILDIDLPPQTASDFQSTQARFGELSGQMSQLEQQIETVAQQGAQAPSGIILPGVKSAEQSIEQLEKQRDSLLHEMEPLQQRILAYATWSRRTAGLTRLIASLTAGAKESPLLVVLAPYPVELIAQWATTAELAVFFAKHLEAQAQAWQKTALAVVPEDRIEIAFWNDAQEFGSQVWRRVRSSEPAFFTIPDDPAFFPVGLIDALRRGRALLPRGRPSAQTNIDQIQDGLNSSLTGDHAVLVESDGSVSSLIGALYAHHCGARFVVNPASRVNESFDRMRAITEGVQKEQLAALAANAYRYIGEHRKEFMQSQSAEPQLKQIAAGLSVLELPATVPTPYSDQAFVQALSTYLTAQQAGAQQGYRYDDSQWTKDLAALEADVSASISAHTQQALAGVSHVTAFTGGLPYGLAPSLDGKAVGLVLHDLAAPFILSAVAQAHGGRPALTLALNIDPGLQQRPAPDVPGAVDRTLTLRGPAASLSNVALLAGLLPLDSVLLHTQGNLDSVILGDPRNRLVEVHGSEFSQQVRLGSSPLVIYGVPMAWLSMGVAMLEQGAGGFVGALWPISDVETEDAVRFLLDAVVAKGKNPAEAVRSLPTFDPRAKRAFVYLGTGVQQAAPAAHVADGAPVLYGVAARLAALGRSDAATLVFDRMRAMVGEMVAGDPALRGTLTMLEADFQVRLAGRRRERPAQDTLDKLAQSLDQIDKLKLQDEQKRDLQTAVKERMALLEQSAQNFERAAALLAEVCAARHAGGQIAGELAATYQLAVVQENQKQWATARQTLLGVQSQLGALGNAVGMVTVATSLAYVSLPLAMYPDVLGHLKLAVQASVALGVQILSETLVQTLSITRAMAQMGAVADLKDLAHALAQVLKGDRTLPERDRTAISGIFSLIEETAAVLQASLPIEEREGKLAALVEKAQQNDLARSLGMDAWLLGAGSPSGPTEDDGPDDAAPAEGASGDDEESAV